MALLYLIRHPHTQIDLDAPAHTWGLSDEGHAQTEALVEAAFWQHVTAIYPSGEHKTILPAKAVAARYDLPVTPLPALGEVDRSAYTSSGQVTYEAAVEVFFAYPKERFRGWETAAHALKRFQNGITKVLARHDDSDSIAVVSHGLVLTLYMAHLRDETPSMDRWRGLGFCTVAAVDRATMCRLTDFVAAPYANLPEP